MWKMRFFEVWHVEIAQKLQILQISTIFGGFLVDFAFSLIFWGGMEKKFCKMVKWVGIEGIFQGNMIFGLNLAQEPK